MTKWISIGGCSCCAETPDVVEIGEVLMPDGKLLKQVRDVEGGQTYWIDRDLDILGGDWD